MSAQSVPAPPKLALVLLGLMTLVTFTGPFVIAHVIRGGRSHVWPPDRPVEWWTFGLITGAVAVLMIGCLASGAIARALDRKRSGLSRSTHPTPPRRKGRGGVLGHRSGRAPACGRPGGHPVTLVMIAAGLVAGSFVVSTTLCALARRWAPRLGLLDRPGGHKGHQAPTPLGGGVAIWLTVVGIIGLGMLTIALGGSRLPGPIVENAGGIRERAGELGLILGLATGIMLMGLLDDHLALSWRLRLGIQFGVATVLAASGVRVTLFPPLSHPLIGGTVTVFWIVGLTNAFNLLDNMDGLAAGVGLIASALFAGAQVAVGSLFAPAVLLVLVGALGGFLVHNHNPARLFMGDAGSNFLGFLIGALTVAGTYYRYDAHYSKASILAPLLVMAVPLYDTTSVMIIRWREGRSLFQGDRRHFSHRLVERGLTPRQAVRTIDLVTLASGLGALLLHRLEGLAWVVVVQTVCLLGVVAILEVSANRSE